MTTPGEKIEMGSQEIRITSIRVPAGRRALRGVAELAESIKAVGLLNPITITEECVLVAGAHRLEACKLLGWKKIPAGVVKLSGLLAELAEIDENLCRNELTALEQAEHLHRRKQVYEALHPETKQGAAPAKKSGKGGKAPKGKNDNLSGLPASFAADTSKKSGLTERSVQRGVQIAKDISESVREQIRSTPIAESKTELLALARQSPEKQQVIADKVSSGQAASVKEALAEVKLEAKKALAEQIRAEPLPQPEGPFRVIAIDPPWRYDSRVEDATHRGRNQYPDMTVEEICALPVADLAHEDCVLWLWTTNAFMPDAFRCLGAWGFTHKTILTWDKELLGLGDYLRNVTEHCLLAVRGKPTLTLTNQTTIIREARREHSRKPAAFYALVEALCPGSKLEMFSRENRPGWATWGAEPTKFAEEESHVTAA